MARNHFPPADQSGHFRRATILFILCALILAFIAVAQSATRGRSIFGESQRVISSKTDAAPVRELAFTVTPIGSVPKRLRTGGYLLGYHGAKITGAQLAQIAPILDLVELDGPHVAVFKRANPNGRTMFYEDPHRVIGSDHIATYLTENNYARCGGQRLEGTYAGKRMYNVDVRDPESPAKVAQELAFRSSGITEPGYRWDYWFADDTAPPTVGFQCMPDGYRDTDWGSADASYLEKTAALASIPVIYNGAAKESGGVPYSGYLAGKNHIAGGMAEACFSQTPRGSPDGPYIDDVGTRYPLWTNIQKAVLRLQQYRPKQLFICYSNDLESSKGSDNTYAADIRTYVLASFLMFYDPQTTYLWENFSTNSTVTVQPESGLIALNPLRGTPRSADASDVASFHCGGAYCREYNDCFYNGVRVGYCAVEINATHGPPVSAAFPSGRSYRRAMVLEGSGMLTTPGTMATDNGRVSFTGSPPTSLCSPGSATHSVITGCVTAAIVFGPTPHARTHQQKARHKQKKHSSTKKKHAH